MINNNSNMNNWLMKKIGLLFIGVLLCASSSSAQDGQQLYKENCASCHSLDKVSTGPILKGARERWIKNSSEENFYLWIENSAAVIETGDLYAVELKDFDKSTMPKQSLTREEIDAVIDHYSFDPCSNTRFKFE